MKLEQSFEVAAPIDEVWAALTDLELWERIRRRFGSSSSGR
jgi:carbon monoxide dehydrogenase subunit G